MQNPTPASEDDKPDLTTASQSAVRENRKPRARRGGYRTIAEALDPCRQNPRSRPAPAGR